MTNETKKLLFFGGIGLLFLIFNPPPLESAPVLGASVGALPTNSSYYGNPGEGQTYDATGVSGSF